MTRAHDPQTTVAGVRLWGKNRTSPLGIQSKHSPFDCSQSVGGVSFRGFPAE